MTRFVSQCSFDTNLVSFITWEKKQS